jgi:hypothetical protein
LSIHVYQESENLEQRAAFRATIANFLARLVITLSFVGLVLVLPSRLVALVSLAWGLMLLGTITFLLARTRHVSPLREMLTHLVVAAAVVVVSRALALGVGAHIH